MHFVSETCHGEPCGMCYRQFRTVPATHKVGEEIPGDFPDVATHNLTQYVCCQHFAEIMGAATSRWRGCTPSP